MRILATPPRILVVGAGPAARDLHLPILARLRDAGRLVLAHLCDLDPACAQAAMRDFGFAACSGDAHAAVARPDIDAVYLFGSAQMHAALGMAALRAGKHLFVEKPIAPTHVEAQAMAELAAANGLIAVGGHNRRFLTSLNAVRARGESWRFATAIFHKPEFGRPVPFGAKSWLTANGIHALDALVFLMGGLPQHLTSLSDGAMFSALMRWPDGAQASFLCNNQAGRRQEEYLFQAPGETCRVTEEGLFVETASASRSFAMPILGDGLRQEHEAFLDAVSTGIAPVHAIAALAPSLRLAELIEDGFNGAVPRPPPAPRDTAGQSGAILVIQPAALLPALTRYLPQARLVSLQDLGDAPRPDIVALLVGGGAQPLPAHLPDQLPNLRVAGIRALSLERYRPEPLLARGIPVVNATEAYADSVAEFALGLAILGRRRAFTAHETMRAGGWGTALRMPGMMGHLRRTARALRPVLRHLRLEAPALRAWRAAIPPAAGANISRDLRGATAGLIGWGPNAQAFARLLAASGARVLAWSQHADSDALRAAGAIPASLAEVLAADIVSLHRALTPQTRHSIGAAELARLRPGALLINVARGALIEPGALRARLKQSDIFACLDTFETEPPAASDPLRRMPNAFLTPHIAGGSCDMHEAAADEVVRKVRRVLDEGGQAISA